MMIDEFCDNWTKWENLRLQLLHSITHGNVEPGDVKHTDGIQVGTHVRILGTIKGNNALVGRTAVVVKIDDYHDHDHARYEVRCGQTLYTVCRRNQLEVCVQNFDAWAHGTEIVTKEADVEVELYRIGSPVQHFDVRGIIIKHSPFSATEHKDICYHVLHRDGEAIWYFPEQLELYDEAIHAYLNNLPEEEPEIRKLDLGQPLIGEPEEQKQEEDPDGWTEDDDVQEAIDLLTSLGVKIEHAETIGPNKAKEVLKRFRENNPDVQFEGGWGPDSMVEDIDDVLDDNPVPLPEPYTGEMEPLGEDEDFTEIPDVPMTMGDAVQAMIGEGVGGPEVFNHPTTGEFTRGDLDQAIRTFMIDYLPPTSQIGDLAHLVSRLSHMIRLRWDSNAQV